MKVSVLLLTLNEAGNLPRCLDALTWCDDIVIVDSGSTDGTLEIARARNIRVLHHGFDDFASQRNFGVAAAGFQHQWVLHLDADEVVTPTFESRLLGLVPKEGIDAYYVPSKTIFLGRWLRYAGMYPAYQVRLGRAGKLQFQQVGHGQREDMPPQHIGIFDEPYLHYSFSQGFKLWLAKHLRYAAEEAEELIRLRNIGNFPLRHLFSTDRVKRRRAAKSNFQRVPLFFRPALRFVYIYVFRRGFLDGRAGFVYAFMLATYEAMIAILAYEQIIEQRVHGQKGMR